MYPSLAWRLMYDVFSPVILTADRSHRTKVTLRSRAHKYGHASCSGSASPQQPFIWSDQGWGKLRTVLGLNVGYFRCSNHDDQKVKLENERVSEFTAVRDAPVDWVLIDMSRYALRLTIWSTVEFTDAKLLMWIARASISLAGWQLARQLQ